MPTCNPIHWDDLGCCDASANPRPCHPQGALASIATRIDLHSLKASLSGRLRSRRQRSLRQRHWLPCEKHLVGVLVIMAHVSAPARAPDPVMMRIVDLPPPPSSCCSMVCQLARRHFRWMRKAKSPAVWTGTPCDRRFNLVATSAPACSGPPWSKASRWAFHAKTSHVMLRLRWGGIEQLEHGVRRSSLAFRRGAELATHQTRSYMAARLLVATVPLRAGCLTRTCTASVCCCELARCSGDEVAPSPHISATHSCPL